MLKLKDVLPYIPSRDARVTLSLMNEYGSVEHIYTESEVYGLYLRHDPMLSLSVSLLQRADRYAQLYEQVDNADIRYDIASIVRYYRESFRSFRSSLPVSDSYVVSKDGHVVDKYDVFTDINMASYNASDIRVYQVQKSFGSNLSLDDIYEYSTIEVTFTDNGMIRYITDDDAFDMPNCRHGSWYFNKYVFVPYPYHYGDFVRVIYGDKDIAYGITMISDIDYYKSEVITVLNHTKVSNENMGVSEIFGGISTIPVLVYWSEGFIDINGEELTCIEKIDKYEIPSDIRISLETEFNRKLSESIVSTKGRYDNE